MRNWLEQEAETFDTEIPAVQAGLWPVVAAPLEGKVPMFTEADGMPEVIEQAPRKPRSRRRLL